jgi:hypothetical protein
MPKIPRRLAAIPVLTRRQQYLAVINHSTHCIFSLDPDTLSLTEYYWYVVQVVFNPDSPDYRRVMVRAGLSKERNV